MEARDGTCRSLQQDGLEVSEQLKFDVFLSHSAKDKDTVRQIAAMLRRDGVRVWFDEWEIKPGDNIPAKIEEGLESSRVLVLCMSSNAFASDWAALESQSFRFRDPMNKTRRFLPLRLDETPIKGTLAQFMYISWLPEQRENEYPNLLSACLSRGSSGTRNQAETTERSPARIDATNTEKSGWKARIGELCKAVVAAIPYLGDAYSHFTQSRESRDTKQLLYAALSSRPPVAQTVIDKAILVEVNTLRRSRFFPEYDRETQALSLGRRVSDGELSGGTAETRSMALAWCSRILSRTDRTSELEELLDVAQKLCVVPEVQIAEAFVHSHKGDKSSALSLLATLNTPSARSAAFMIVHHHDGPTAAIDWLNSAGLVPDELDSEGKLYLICRRFEVGDWYGAAELARAINDAEFSESPALYRVSAVALLAVSVPNELRGAVINHVPFDVARFPLSWDPESLAARQTSIEQFCAAAALARELGFRASASTADEYVIWLQLKDPASTAAGKRLLRERLREPGSRLRFIPLALQFGEDVDVALVEREIESQTALHGKTTYDAALARFSLAFMQPSPNDVAAYISKHIDGLSGFLDRNAMRFIQIEMLAKGGQSDRATEILNVLVKEGIADAEEDRLRALIGEAGGSDLSELRVRQFRKSGALGDLQTLVDVLHEKQDWENLYPFSLELFARTHDIQDARRVVVSLQNLRRTADLVEFFEGNQSLLGHSADLHFIYCSALYNEGRLPDAQAELAKFEGDRDSPDYRSLCISLNIASGNWCELVTFVADEYQKSDRRSARDLIAVAQLAIQVNSLHAKSLVKAATAKADNDAAVFCAAYFLASSAGWEDESEPVQWLQKAADLSGDAGPIQRVTLDELLNQKPEWDQHEAMVWSSLTSGEIPMFVAARGVNKSLIHLMLFPAFSNLSEVDPRRRAGIPAFSGCRQARPLNTGSTIAVDGTALLTMSFLGILDKVMRAFPRVYIPHSTLHWLFEEKQKAKFHQPSRIKQARMVRDLLATEMLVKFRAHAKPNSELAMEVGDELAAFLAEAKFRQHEAEFQHVVVRPSPVHRLSTLLKEEADLEEYSSLLSCCSAVVDALHRVGRITAGEQTRAHSYLKLHEKPWPHQPEISDGAILYLDDLAVSYLSAVGVIEKLKPAGFTAIISPREVSQLNDFLLFEQNSKKIEDVIENTRSLLTTEIECGRVKLGRQHEHETYEYPTMGIFALSGECNAAILDDRCLNKYEFIGNSPDQLPTFSTLDVIGTLVATGAVSRQEELELRHRLRCAGYFFIPVRPDELSDYLGVAEIREGVVVESAELRAIRENFLRVRMSDWLQLPREAPWLGGIYNVFQSVLRDLWISPNDIATVRAQSDWLLTQLDVHGWAHRLAGDDQSQKLESAKATGVLTLLVPPEAESAEVKKAYWQWLEERVLVPIKDLEPDFYAWLVERERNAVAYLSNLDLEEKG